VGAIAPKPRDAADLRSLIFAVPILPFAYLGLFAASGGTGWGRLFPWTGVCAEIGTAKRLAVEPYAEVHVGRCVCGQVGRCGRQFGCVLAQALGCVELTRAMVWGWFAAWAAFGGGIGREVVLRTGCVPP